MQSVAGTDDAACEKREGQAIPHSLGEVTQMQRNMGSTDRAIRAFVVAPVAIVAAVIVGAGSVGGIIALAVAAIMLATAAIGFCPLYVLFGIATTGNRVRRSRGGTHAGTA